MNNSLLSALKTINEIKKREIVLPIAKKTALVSPLTIGDDLSLKTSIMNPVLLDSELLKLLYNHTEFRRDINDETTEEKTTKGKKKEKVVAGSLYKPSLQDFFNEISYFDKIMLIWGIYDTTYGDLGERDVVCENCKESWKETVTLDSLIQEDSITIFEPETPFHQFSETITIPYKDEWVLEFEARIPSLKNYNQLMQFITIDEIQKNLEKIRSQFDKPQLISLFTKKLSLVNTKTGERIESLTTQEILMSLTQAINLQIGDAFMEEYSKLFDKYNIKFYTSIKCPHCQHDNKIYVDLEFEFFRRALPSGE